MGEGLRAALSQVMFFLLLAVLGFLNSWRMLLKTFVAERKDYLSMTKYTMQFIESMSGHNEQKREKNTSAKNQEICNAVFIEKKSYSFQCM